MMFKKINWLLATFMVAAMGCSSIEEHRSDKAPIVLNTNLFNPLSTVVSEQELYHLTEQQQQEFLSFYQLQISKGYLPHLAIHRFFESKLTNFTYYGKTYIASKAMLESSGNCMSLAILTTALSRLVGVEMDYRKMHSLPIYEKHGNIILSSSHVQSLLYDPSFVPDEEYFYLSRPGIVIDYFPQEGNLRSKRVDSNVFLAMYYVNKAAEYYIESALDNAFAYAQEAYRLDSESTSAMNLLALLHKKRGDEATAERLYLAALESSDVNISVMDNYVSLLKKQGKLSEARKVKQRIENIYDPNPYHWLEKAQLARQQNEYEDAERFYRKTIKLAPYVKQAYLELHEVYLLQDKKQQAITTLQQSLLWVHEPEQKRKYKRQLYQLSQAI
jgi:tetratricopeptide (TPR) repeat protein